MYVELNRLAGITQIRRARSVFTVPVPVSQAPELPRFGVPVPFEARPEIPRFGAPTPTVTMMPSRPVSWPQPGPVSPIPTAVVAMTAEVRRKVAGGPISYLQRHVRDVIRAKQAFDRRIKEKQLWVKPKAPGGANAETTQIEVIGGVDPSIVGVKESGAATTGQDLSIKEQSPNTVIITEDAGQLRIQPREVPKSVEPAIPLFKAGIDIIPPDTFIEAAAEEKSKLMKYGLLGFGAYILFKSFSEHAKPAPRRRRPRRRRHR